MFFFLAFGLHQGHLVESSLNQWLERVLSAVGVDLGGGVQKASMQDFDATAVSARCNRGQLNIL